MNWQPGITLEQIEKEVILKALRFYNDNRQAAANALGVSVRTIGNKLAKYNGEKEPVVVVDLEEDLSQPRLKTKDRVEAKNAIATR